MGRKLRKNRTSFKGNTKGGWRALPVLGVRLKSVSEEEDCRL